MGGLAVGNRYGKGLTDVTRRIAEYTNNEGLIDFVVFRQTGNAVDTETITIGSDVWRVDELNTSLGTCTGGDGNYATGPLTLTLATHGRIAGDGLLIGSELMRVSSVTDVNTVVVNAIDRALGGTALAAHVDTTAVYGSAHAGAWSTATPVQIPVFISSTLTDTVFVTIFTAFVVERYGKDVQPVDQSYTAISPDTLSVLILRDKRRGYGTPLVVSETMTSGAFDHTSMGGSGAPARRRIAQGVRVPTAGEVTEGFLYIPHDFEANPVSAIVQIVVTSSGVHVAWDGGITFVAPTVVVAEGAGMIAQEKLIPGYVVLDNTGSTDWATTDTIYFLLAE